MKTINIILAIIILSSCKKVTQPNVLPGNSTIQVQVTSNYKQIKLSVYNITSEQMIYSGVTPGIIDTNNVVYGYLFETNKLDKYKISYDITDSIKSKYINNNPLYSNMKVFISGYEKYNFNGILNYVNDTTLNINGEFYINN